MVKTHSNLDTRSSARRGWTWMFSLCMALGILATGCGQQKGGQGNSPLQVQDSHFIINGVDWKEVTSIPQKSAIRKNSRAVGNLTIFKGGGFISRCTAFLVSNNILMTNYHCVNNNIQARGAYVEFRHEYGVTYKNRARYTCDTFIHGNQRLDMALLRCQGNPGAVHGVVQLESAPAKSMRVYEPIYVIHQNCNHEQFPSCEPNKKYSPGKIIKTPANTYPQLQFDADTLQGSSGSPVFSSRTHKVVALNNVGLYQVGPSGQVMGEANGGVAMSAIVSYLKAKYPAWSIFHKNRNMYSYR